MADRRDVVEFIKEIEKHPCIYNVTMPEYSNRNETKRSWGKIAEVMDCTENECKEKWRKLRIAFMRSLKHMRATNQTNKPYYLYDYLTFLLPFVKNGDQNGDQQPQEHDDTLMQLSPDYSDDEELMMSKKNSKIEVESDEDSIRNEVSGGHIVYLNDRVTDRSRNESYTHDRQRQVIEAQRKRKKTEDVEDNPRKMFLLSLLPDIESFSEDEMRAFRRNIVSCIDNIIDGRKKQT